MPFPGMKNLANRERVFKDSAAIGIREIKYSLAIAMRNFYFVGDRRGFVGETRYVTRKNLTLQTRAFVL